MLPSEILDTLPTDTIREALQQFATPGTYGSVEIEVYLTPEAVENLDVVQVRNLSHQRGKPAAPTAIDPERKLLVEKAVRGIQERAARRRLLARIGAHFGDGRLLKYNVEHRS